MRVSGAAWCDHAGEADDAALDREAGVPPRVKIGRRDPVLDRTPRSGHLRQLLLRRGHRMCDACEDWDARDKREPGSHHVALRAREIERAMPGDPVPDAAWGIALGEATGAIAWAHQMRIMTAMQAAAAQPAPMPFGRRRRAKSFACAAAV